MIGTMLIVLINHVKVIKGNQMRMRLMHMIVGQGLMQGLIQILNILNLYLVFQHLAMVEVSWIKHKIHLNASNVLNIKEHKMAVQRVDLINVQKDSS